MSRAERSQDGAARGEAHGRDAVSLMAGLLVLLLAGLFLVTDLTDVSVDGRWAVPVVLICVGAVGLLSTLRSRSRRTGRTDDLPTDHRTDGGPEAQEDESLTL